MVVRIGKVVIAVAWVLAACNSYEGIEGTPLDRAEAAPTRGAPRSPNSDDATLAEADAGAFDDVPPPTNTNDDAGASPSCAIADGSYQLAAATYVATDGTCVLLADEWKKQSGAGPIVLTKVDDDVWESRGASASSTSITWTLNKSKCELVRTAQQTVDWQDSAGKAAQVTTSTTSRMSFAGSKLTFEAKTQLTSTTPGATGFPCTITTQTSGIK